MAESHQSHEPRVVMRRHARGPLGLRWPAAACVGVMAAVTVFALGTASFASGAPRGGDQGRFNVGFADYLYGVADRSEREFQLTKSVNADIVRINLYWRLVAPSRPADPRDPADPAYNWGQIDNAVRGAADHGFEVEMTALSAPAWAEGNNRPSVEKAPIGTWRPDAAAFSDFAHALAVRYSGSYSAGGSVLPAVHYFQAWNEPNLISYLTPQWRGRKNLSSSIYVHLLNGFFDEIKAVNPAAQVVTAGTAPYGDPTGGPLRTRPIRFYQELLCLTPKNKRGSCPDGEQPRFDIVAHHPINREDPPNRHALNPGDVEIADFGELTDVLRKAERLGTPWTSGRHELWADEVWWQTNPPDKHEGVALRKQARWMAQGMYLLWKQGASNVTFLQFRDAKYRRGEPTFGSYQTGVYTYGGRRKPSADSVEFPLVGDRKGRKLTVWGIAPRGGKLAIEVRGKRGFDSVKNVSVDAGSVFLTRIRAKSSAMKIRARVGGETSPTWVQR